MNQLDAVFGRGRRTLVCYLPLGDPAIEFELAPVYEAAGVDVFEVGVPNGRPYLDGPVVSDSLRRASSAGVSGRRAAKVVGEIRNSYPDKGLVWMTYSSMSRPRALLESVIASGADGLLVPGRRPDDSDVGAVLGASGVHQIPFLPHDPTLRDVATAVETGGGYAMLQAVPALTGTRLRQLPDSRPVIGMVRRLGLGLPVAMGVGISTPAQAADAVRMGANGVIIGTAVVDAALRGKSRLTRLLRSLREALDGA